MKDSAKAALVQLTLGPHTPGAIDRMPAFFDQPSAYGSDLNGFPEYVLGNRIGADDPHGVRFRELAAEHAMYAIAGLVESPGTRWATTALMIDREGTILGRYRKSHPASGGPPYSWPPVSTSPSVAEAKGSLGSQSKVFHLAFGQVGILQCYDG